MKIEIIWIDLDGVIASFSKRYEELYKTPLTDRRNKEEFHGNFKHFIDNGHFATLDKMPDADVLLEYLGGVDVPKFILSSTAYDKVHDEVSEQKDMWLASNLIHYPAVFVPGKRLKVKYAKPNSILIDDTKANIDDWNTAGGIGILHTDAKTTIQKLIDILGD